MKPIDKILTSYVVDIHEHVPEEGGKGIEGREGGTANEDGVF